MAEMNFGGVVETVVTSKEFSLEKAREVLKNEVSVRVRPMTRLLPTDGFPVRRCSLSRRQQRRVLSSACCFLMLVRFNSGPLSRNI